MPPKTTTCSICNQEVLKSQTLMKADGTRACRSHSGVEDEAKLLKERDQNRINREIKNKKKRFNNSTNNSRLRQPSSKRPTKNWNRSAIPSLMICGRRCAPSTDIVWRSPKIAKKCSATPAKNICSVFAPHPNKWRN